METFSALLAICAGSSPVPGEFPAQRPVTRRFDIFFDLHPNKRLSKQWRGWWFETPPCPLRRHLNVSCRYVFVLCCYDLLNRKSVPQWAAAGHNETRREIWLKPMVLHRITATALSILACHHIDYASTWWRHQMETFSALLALCAGNSPVPVNSPHKGQWRGALMFSLMYAWINDWVNNREAGDLRRHRGHSDVIVILVKIHVRMTRYLFGEREGDLTWEMLQNIYHAFM